MATRYYPSVRAINAIIRGAAVGEWGINSCVGSTYGPDQVIWELMTSKVDAGVLQPNWNPTTNLEDNYDLMFGTWMSPQLEAQTISGTFNLCFGVSAAWIDLIDEYDLSDVRFKVHIYITEGNTKAVRHTLLDNYVDPVDFPYMYGTYLYVWKSLASTQTLSSGDAEEGDRIAIELGMRIVDSPTPTPTYPPSANTHIKFVGTGANVAYTDATDGDAYPSSRNSWFEFSADIAELDPPDPPSNDECAAALSIPSIPYNSGPIDTSQSEDTERRIWFSFTASKDGIIIVSTHGSNYRCEPAVFSACGGFALSALQSSTYFNAPRSLGMRAVEVSEGVTYKIRISSYPSDSSCAPNSGGIAQVHVFYVEEPAKDDIYLPSGSLMAIRDGQYVNMTNSLISYVPTGIAIDYTQTPIADQNGGTNSNYRVLVGLHNYELVEILDLPTLNLGQFEVDYIGDPWFVGGVDIHPAQIVVTAAGVLHVGWFGDGYLRVAGTGILPAMLNTVSSNSSYSALKSILAANGDNQLGAPFSDTERVLDVQVTAPWAIALNENNGILYYTSGGFYAPVGGDTIKRYSLNTDTQLTDFATLTLYGLNPGLKGLAVLPDGGLLVCNGDRVQRLNSSGTITQTYTPSIAIDSQCLVDVQLTADQDAFWVIDLPSTRMFQFDLDTGTELQTFQPYGIMGTLVQFAVYTAGEEPPPPPETGTIQVLKVTSPSEDPTVFDLTAGGGLDPDTFQLGDGESQLYTDVPAGDGYSIAETPQVGWVIRYTVSNGSPIDDISVEAGETVIVTVLNTKNLGGIYKLVPGKRYDTVFTAFSPLTTEDVKIPDPFIKTALLGE